MKKSFMIVIFIILSYNLFAEENIKHHKMMKYQKDDRISLGLPPIAKNRQLANMRSHLEVIQNVVSLIANEKFDEASKIVDEKLGLTAKMMKECKKMQRKDFQKMGFAFHDSAKELSNALKSRDSKKSLKALSNTLNYCVSCHATFKQ